MAERGTSLPTSVELFEDWVDEGRAEVALEQFRLFGLPEEFDAPLWSRRALVQLEDVLLSRYADEDELSAAQGPWVDGAVRYVGALLMRRFGGRWDYTSEVGSPLAGRPFLVLDARPELPVTPFGAFLAAVRERTGSVLPGVWDAMEAAEAERPGGRPSPSSADEVAPEVAAYLNGAQERVAVWASGVAAPAERWDGSAESLEELGREVAARDLPASGDVADDAFLAGAVDYLGLTAHALHGGRWVFGSGEKDPMDPFAARFFLLREHPEDDDIRSLSPEFSVEVAAEEHDPSHVTIPVENYALPFKD